MIFFFAFSSVPYSISTAFWKASFDCSTLSSCFSFPSVARALNKERDAIATMTITPVKKDDTISFETFNHNDSPFQCSFIST